MILRRLSRGLERLPRPVRPRVAVIMRRSGGGLYRAGSLVKILGRSIERLGHVVVTVADTKQWLGERMRQRAEVLAAPPARSEYHPPMSTVDAQANARNNVLAKECLAAARTLEGVRFLERHLAEAPHDAETATTLAQLQLGLAEPARGLEVLREAARRGADQMVIQTSLGDMQYRLFRVGAMIQEHAGRTVGADEPPGSTIFSGALAVEDLRAATRKALDLAIANPLSRDRRGETGRAKFRATLLEHAEGNSDVALRRVAETLGANSGYPWMHYLRGRILEKQGDRAKAVRAYRQAVALQPAFGATHRRLGRMYFRDGNIAQAVEHYDASLAGSVIDVESQV